MLSKMIKTNSSLSQKYEDYHKDVNFMLMDELAIMKTVAAKTTFDSYFYELANAWFREHYVNGRETMR